MSINAIEQLKEIVENKDYNIKPPNFRDIIGKIIEANRISELSDYLALFLQNAPSDFYSQHIALVVLSVYEKYIDKHIAIDIAQKVINQQPKLSFALASLLRICRSMNNYSKADELFISKPELLSLATFEVLYELTYYYSSHSNMDKIDRSLELMVTRYKSSLPILKTATALSIRYGLYEKYQQKLAQYHKSYILDSDNPQSIREEIEEEEYQKVFRSAALADLTKGIAHEFGQPVTNIRFNIQYYSKLFENEPEGMVQKQQVVEIFNDILLQTERIGKLIDTLSPITSSNSTATAFDIKNAIDEIVGHEKIKLLRYGIDVETSVLSGDIPIIITFDKTQFGQVITNLLNNAIDSIVDGKKEQTTLQGKIKITITPVGSKVSVCFSDNGGGFKNAEIDRIFNPFYTTKPPDKGQGLGLYIVSNLLKMNGGRISVDRKNKNGAKFIMLIPKN